MTLIHNTQQFVLILNYSINITIFIFGIELYSCEGYKVIISLHTNTYGKRL